MKNKIKFSSSENRPFSLLKSFLAGNLIKRKVGHSSSIYTWQVGKVYGWGGSVPYTTVCLDKGKIWEPQECRRWVLTQAGNGGGLRDDFPEEATTELSSEGCLHTNQAEGVREVLKEQQSPVK